MEDRRLIWRMMWIMKGRRKEDEEEDEESEATVSGRWQIGAKEKKPGPTF